MLVILQCSSFAYVLVDLCVASVLAALGFAYALATLGILRFIVKLNLCIHGFVLTSRAIP
jgi:hypothetical protein